MPAGELEAAVEASGGIDHERLSLVAQGSLDVLEVAGDIVLRDPDQLRQVASRRGSLQQGVVKALAHRGLTRRRTGGGWLVHGEKIVRNGAALQRPASSGAVPWGVETTA